MNYSSYYQQAQNQAPIHAQAHSGLPFYTARQRFEQVQSQAAYPATSYSMTHNARPPAHSHSHSYSLPTNTPSVNSSAMVGTTGSTQPDNHNSGPHGSSLGQPPPHLRHNAFAFKQFDRPPQHPAQQRRTGSSRESSPVRGPTSLPQNEYEYVNEGGKEQGRGQGQQAFRWNSVQDYQPPYAAAMVSPATSSSSAGATAGIGASSSTPTAGRSNPNMEGVYGYRQGPSYSQNQQHRQDSWVQAQALMQHIPPTALWLQSVYNPPGGVQQQSPNRAQLSQGQRTQMERTVSSDVSAHLSLIFSLILHYCLCPCFICSGCVGMSRYQWIKVFGVLFKAGLLSTES